jgi:alpha,alpha-trehalase
VARPLPRNLLADLTQRKRLLLCLDFDGALAATTAHPEDAAPVEGAARALRTLIGHREDVVIAIVSGRDANATRRMLGISRELYFIGLHGIELLDADDHRELLVQVSHCLPALHTVRDWLTKEARSADGFMVEDKEFSVALHFRNANPELARDICRQLEYFVVHMIRGLRVSYGDMVVEVIPSNAGGIGFAISHLLARLNDKSLMPVYFGDDPSDEEAFFVVRRAGGAAILVGPDRDTHAEYRVDTPEDVAAALAALADALQRPADAPTP